MGIISIAAINLKGGSCKTSTIINLSGALYDKGHKPIVIDLDPQQSASRWAKQGGDKFPYPVIAMEVGKSTKLFKTQLDKLIEKHKATAILFDTAPQLSDAALVAALLCDIALIPLTPSPLDLWAAEEAIATIQDARKERNGLPKIAFVPSRLMPNTLLAKELHGSLIQFKELIAPSISMRVAIAESAIAGLPVSQYAPGSPSHNEFTDLLKFVFTNLRK